MSTAPERTNADVASDLAGMIADYMGSMLRGGSDDDPGFPGVDNWQQTGPDTAELTFADGRTATIQVTIT